MPFGSRGDDVELIGRWQDCAVPRVFEHASFTVTEGHEQALLAERPAMIEALRKAFPGLEASWLVQRDDGSWLDVIVWASRAEAEYAAEHVSEVPEAVAGFTHIEESHGIEHLTVRSIP
jgi:hypothetical protein